MRRLLISFAVLSAAGPLAVVAAVEAKTPAKQCVVPDVKGELVATARQQLIAVHCSLGRAGHPPGTGLLVVRSQMPRAGADERAGTRVNLEVQRVPVAFLARPEDLTTPATSAAGAVVKFKLPTATGARGTSVEVACSIAPGAQLPIGVSIDVCKATDRSGHTARVSFPIDVTAPTTPPTLSSIPSDMTVAPATPAGSQASFVMPTASDVFGRPVAVTCTTAPGAVIPAGTTVTDSCTATDVYGNTGHASFTIAVQPIVVKLAVGYETNNQDTVQSTLPSSLTLALSQDGGPGGGNTEGAFLMVSPSVSSNMTDDPVPAGAVQATISATPWQTTDDGSVSDGPACPTLASGDQCGWYLDSVGTYTVTLTFKPSGWSESNPAVASSAVSVTAQPVGDPGNWNLVLASQFNGSSLDSSVWRPGWFGTGVTSPVASTEDDCYGPSNVNFTGDGYLSLNVTATSSTCDKVKYPYTGALISSNPDDGRASGGFQYTYGFAEASIYVPGNGSQIANWPAFWADSHVWPTDGEDDVMEGIDGRACSTFHNAAGFQRSCDAAFTPGWHTFASDWEPGSITYYYDGVAIGSETKGITSAPMFLVLDYTVSKKYPALSDAPSSMEVAYVRVWQHPPS